MSVTLVSCYYKLNKSKHSLQEYDFWIKNFLLNIKTNIIIFVGKNEMEYIKSIIVNNTNIKYLLIEKEINDFELVKKYNNGFWNWQESIDPNKTCGRGQDCYKIWNSKFNFLKEAILLNPFNSDKFIWNDIGNVRNINIVNKCLNNNYPKYENISNNKLDIVLLKKFNDFTQSFFQDEVHFSGSMFGGGKEILLELCDLFYIYFEIYVKKGKFIGCDQQIIATLFLKNQDKFNCVYPKNIKNGTDEWFYLYDYYSISI
jgi:hypothetical protein